MSQTFWSISNVRNLDRLDQLELKCAKVELAIYELERIRERMAELLPALRAASLAFDELRRINTAKCVEQQ